MAAGTPMGGRMQQSCRRIVLQGDVAAGQEWSSAIGEGWVFRAVPIGASAARNAVSSSGASGTPYTGWDLAVSRSGDAGYPDALLLATPPYGSLNEREIGTTFGLRAQDAIAWGPRRFHFLTSAGDLERGRKLFAAVMSPPAMQQSIQKSKIHDSGQGAASTSTARAQAGLLGMVGDSARVGYGEFAVEDAKLVSGVGDPPAYAAQWATGLGRVPHTVVQAGGMPTARGELRWIRFAVTLWLPQGWQFPKAVHAESAKCAE